MRESMKSKGPLKVSNLKAILIATSLSILALLLVIRSNYYYYSSSSSSDSQLSSTTTTTTTTSDSQGIKMREAKAKAKSDLECGKSCNKIPASLAHAILHYTTSNITPQQTFNEISVSSKVLEQKSPCNFLVFGLGHDSLMWASLNYGGRTVFLDEDEAWIKQIKTKFPMLESYKVTYNTKLTQADNLMQHGLVNAACKKVNDVRNSACDLALKGLPGVVYETKWDLIMVDAPTGFREDAPGRMTAIYTAGMMARNRDGGGETDVFVHDVDRNVEDKFSKAFLCEGYLRKQDGTIRHFVIPSYTDGLERSFCPN
ncbi:unnamed protein product [Rhodiola kirilowii]